MARKKSAAKRAKEAEAKNNLAKEIVKKTPVSTNEPIDGDKAPKEEPFSESESSEDEDEYGELLTENVEEQIQKVISTLKSDPKKLLDPEVKFFDESNVTVTKKSGDKPMYLKDYHRLNLLSGDYKNDEDEEHGNEYGTVDGEKPYVVTEREERNKLLEDIKSAFAGDDDNNNDDDGDDFLKKKVNSQTETKESVRLPNPEKNSEEFLSAFLNSQAWIPSKDDKVIDLDAIDKEDEQEFDDAVEDFERAYNFRYEDPNAAEIVSYARTQATLRRSKTNLRKRARDKKNALKEQEKHEIEQALQKKKTAKVNKIIDRLAKIKEAVGEDIDDKVIERVFGDSLLNDDFDDADWDSKMAEIFNEQYYGSEVVKPEWDEEDEIMSEYHNKKAGEEEGGTHYEDQEDFEDNTESADPNVGAAEDLGAEVEQSSSHQSKKDKLKEKKSAKKEKESLKEKAKKIVEANTSKIQEEVEEERGRLRSDDVKFKYREVSPESYGLTTRDIFLADDQMLNQYFSIKKFAPYRPKEQALKDKRKHTKKKQVQHWRYNVFKNINGPERQPNEKENEIWIPIEEEEPKPKKQKNKK